MATLNYTGLFSDGEHGLLIPGSELPKSCPFCGSNDAEIVSCGEVFVGQCSSCGTQGPAGSARLDAANLWNHRGLTVTPTVAG